MAPHQAVTLLLAVGGVVIAAAGISRVEPGPADAPLQPAPLQMQVEALAMLQQDRQKLAALRLSGNAEADFATLMRMQQADSVRLANHYLRYGTDAEMRAAARQLIEVRMKETEWFDEFVARRPRGPQRG